jgi:hypothetical protein
MKNKFDQCISTAIYYPFGNVNIFTLIANRPHYLKNYICLINEHRESCLVSWLLITLINLEHDKLTFCSINLRQIKGGNHNTSLVSCYIGLKKLQ